MIKLLVINANDILIRLRLINKKYGINRWENNKNLVVDLPILVQSNYWYGLDHQLFNHFQLRPQTIEAAMQEFIVKLKMLNSTHVQMGIYWFKILI